MSEKLSRNRAATLVRKLDYASKVLPSYIWQRLTRRNQSGRMHLIIALANHFEPRIMPGKNAGYAPRDVQEKRLDTWCSEYPANLGQLRDSEGRCLTHSYFYPAEQYDAALVSQLAEFCHEGWGEIEIHLHHGVDTKATAESTHQQLVSFRDTLARDHGCLSYQEGDSIPKYAFVHGNFALANSANGYACGVDNEMQILADTGCYVDMTYPAAAFHPAQVEKINSLYECALPLEQRAPHRSGRQLRTGHAIAKLPFIVQGPWMLDFDRSSRNGYGRIENSSITNATPPSLRRLAIWKQAEIAVKGRPDWLFIKLHTHGMDPTQMDAVLRAPMKKFLEELIAGAPERKEILHFVSAREMANILLATCDGREGDPGEFRDYRYRRTPQAHGIGTASSSLIAQSGQPSVARV